MLPPPALLRSSGFGLVLAACGSQSSPPARFCRDHRLLTSIRINIGTVLNGSQTFSIGGTANNSTDVVALTVSDAGLASSKIASYTVVSGDTASTIASKLVTNGAGTGINDITALRNLGITASASGSVLTITSSSTNPTTYVPSITSVNAVPAETVTVGTPPNGTVPIVISSSAGIGSGDSWSITAYDAAYGSSTKSHSYTGGDTILSVATDLATQLSSLSGISAATVDLSSGTAVINVTSTSANLTTYARSVSGNAVVALPLTAGTVQSAYNNVNELTTVSAAGPTRLAGTTDRPVTGVTMNDGAVTATMLSGQSFTANPSLIAGNNDETVTATSGGGTTTTNHYEVSVASPASKSFSYDANGNMTNVSAGTYPQYAYDAEDRLVKIAYDNTGTNYTTMAYDALGRCVNMTEAGTVPAFSSPTVMQFIWCGDARCEVRDSVGTTVLRQFFARGEQQWNGTTLVPYFWIKDHLGSVRELTDTSGAAQVEYTYSLFGNKTKSSGTGVETAFGFAGYYTHDRSNLCLTKARAYSTSLGRWMSRDPVGEAAGLNLFAYVRNSPIKFRDPRGMCPCDTAPRTVSPTVQGPTVPSTTVPTAIAPALANTSVAALVAGPALLVGGAALAAMAAIILPAHSREQKYGPPKDHEECVENAQAAFRDCLQQARLSEALPFPPPPCKDSTGRKKNPRFREDCEENLKLDLEDCSSMFDTLDPPFEDPYYK